MGARKRMSMQRKHVIGGGEGRTPSDVAVGALKRLPVGRKHVHEGGEGRAPRGAAVSARERLPVGPYHARCCERARTGMGVGERRTLMVRTRSPVKIHVLKLVRLRLFVQVPFKSQTGGRGIAIPNGTGIAPIPIIAAAIAAAASSARRAFLPPRRRVRREPRPSVRHALRRRAARTGDGLPKLT